jgi:hypothetical protein
MEEQESRSSRGDDVLDEAFAALRHRQRRRVLLSLLDRPATTLDELVAAAEEDEQRAEVELHHVHVPMLDDAGFVEWDGARRVARGPRFDDVATVVELLDEHGDRLPGPWP